MTYEMLLRIINAKDEPVAKLPLLDLEDCDKYFHITDPNDPDSINRILAALDAEDAS